MAKRPRPKYRNDDTHFAGVERIDATPEEIARALFEPNDRRARDRANAAKALRRANRGDES